MNDMVNLQVARWAAAVELTMLITLLDGAGHGVGPDSRFASYVDRFTVACDVGADVAITGKMNVQRLPGTPGQVRAAGSVESG